jgi:hypothetical protein
MRMNNTGTAHNSIIWANTATNATYLSSSNRYDDSGALYTYCDIAPLINAAGNIAAVPLFRNPSLGDYSLQTNSPCIDAGTWTNGVPAADFADTPRPLDGNNDGTSRPDMGCLEVVHPAADSDGDRMPDVWELAHTLNPVVQDGADDADADHFPNGAEYVAGTDPNGATDFLWVNLATSGASNATVLDWPTVSGRVYTVYQATNGLPAPAWNNLFEAPGNGTPLTFTNTDAAPLQSLFRIGVRIP